MKEIDLSLAYGVHRGTVCHWLADFCKGGEQALKPKPIESVKPARPRARSRPQKGLPRAVSGTG